jgi:transcription initiation factor TFIIF subunit alpha
LITEAEVIALLKSRPRVTTRDLIFELKRKLKRDERNKNILATIVKKVATPVEGVLVLKEGL